MIDISKYSDFFHDGSVIAINHTGNNMLFFMESAEMDEEDMQEAFTLTKDARIRGKLHIENIKSLKINNQISQGPLKQKYDEGGIINLKIEKTSVVLSIDWINFPPHQKTNEFSVIEINAEKIWWENIPD